MTINRPNPLDAGVGAYSAIIFADGDYTVAEDDVGTVIEENADAATVIQAAEDFLEDGDLLVIRPGTYPLTSQVVFNTYRETISAYGAILKPDENAHNVYLGSSTIPYNFHYIFGLRVDATNLTSGGFGIEIHEKYNNFTNCRVNNISAGVTGVKEEGSEAVNTASNRYNNLFLESKHSSPGNGILFGDHSHDAWITNFEFAGYGGGSNTAITINGSAHLFQFMHIYNMQHGIKIDGGNYNRFLNCKLGNFTGNGIYIVPEFSSCIMNMFRDIEFSFPLENAICVNCDGTLQDIWNTYLRDLDILNGSHSGIKVIYQTGGTVADTYLSGFHISTPANLHATPFTLLNTYEIKGGSSFHYQTEGYGTSTGTGAQQTIAHELAGIPDIVMIGNIDNGANPYQSADADTTNIYITSVSGKKWWWKAVYKP